MILTQPLQRKLLGISIFLLASQGSLLALPLRFLAWDDSIAARKLGFLNQSQLSTIEDLHPYQRTQPFNATVGEAPLFLVATDRKDTEGKPVTVEIKVSPGVTAGLVIILPDPKHPSGLRTFVLEDSPGKFAWGSVRLVNATGKNLLFRHDKTVVNIPASWEPVEIAPGGAARNMVVQMAAKDNLKELLYSAVWEHTPDVRNLVLILPSRKPNSTLIDLKTIPEDRRIVAAENASREP